MISTGGRVTTKEGKRERKGVRGKQKTRRERRETGKSKRKQTVKTKAKLGK